MADAQVRIPRELLPGFAARIAAGEGDTISELARFDLLWCAWLREQGLLPPGPAGAVQAEEILRRSRELLLRGRAELRKYLAPEECALLVAATNGVAWDAGSVRLLWAQVDDYLRDAGSDAPGLVEKLRRLDYGAAWVLVDACERYWARPDGERLDPARLLED